MAVSLSMWRHRFKPTRNTFALRVVGDSMIGKFICDGTSPYSSMGRTATGPDRGRLIDRKNTLKTFL